MRKVPKQTLTITVNRQLFRLLQEVQNDLFEQSRSVVVQNMLLDWLLEYRYITDEEYNDLRRGEYYEE